jgi:hypothetical protein
MISYIRLKGRHCVGNTCYLYLLNELSTSEIISSSKR